MSDCPPSRAEYVTVHGHRVWHEVHGTTGEPVVLLHGGFAGASSWAAQIPALAAAGLRVYVPERRGHAHTPDVEGPITYALMAADTIGYLESVVGGPAHLVGWSDGAVVAALVALRRPALSARMVLIGQYYNSEGRVAGSPLDQLLHSPEAMGFLRALYDPYSPDGPEHFPIVYEKMLAMIDSEPEIELSELSRITASTLVVQGDRDLVTLQHSAAIAAALPNGRLAVLPGSHALPLELPEVVNALLTTFLQRGAPEPLWSPPPA
ncbi:MAG: alpha/beta fold hydrolase [Acidimicrobiales bacterium]